MSETRKLLILIAVGFLSLLLAFFMWRSVTTIPVWQTPADISEGIDQTETVERSGG